MRMYGKSFSKIHVLKRQKLHKLAKYIAKMIRLLKKKKKLGSFIFFDKVVRLDFDSPIDETPSIVIHIVDKLKRETVELSVALLFGVDKNRTRYIRIRIRACVKGFRAYRERINKARASLAVYLVEKNPLRFAEDNCRWAGSPCGL